jgi:exodeoxyribonuclease VII small subunit
VARKTQQEEPTFEEALEALEQIIAQMEKGGVPLAGLVESYQKASSLLARCKACLDQADMTVKKLGDDADAAPAQPGAGN